MTRSTPATKHELNHNLGFLICVSLCLGNALLQSLLGFEYSVINEATMLLVDCRSIRAQRSQLSERCRSIATERIHALVRTNKLQVDHADKKAMNDSDKIEGQTRQGVDQELGRIWKGL